MTGKKKKDKKKEKKENQTEQIPALDRQFYELTIADLNNKLARLRSHNARIEEQNEEFETSIKQMEEDKADITAYLNRTLSEKLEIISELEDKLTELYKVREEENRDAFNKLKEWELKYKMMHDQLTSEIKLLNGKLNSLEEFRIQRDELMAKFDEQDAQLREEKRKHKEVFSEMEQKAIQDKAKLRKEVEKKLLELSNEFNRTREIRVAAHTQRLVRENIAINNEMDKMTCTQLRLQEKYDEMVKLDVEQTRQAQHDLEERKQLVKTSEAQIVLLEKLTTEYEKIKAKYNGILETNKKHDNIIAQLKLSQKDRSEMKTKLSVLERRVETIDLNRHNLKTQAQQTKSELERIFGIIKTLRLTVKSAISSNQNLKSTQRENLLLNLLNILTGVEEPKIPLSIEITEPMSYVYKLGNIGFVPKTTRAKSLLKKRSEPKIETTSVASPSHSSPISTTTSPPPPLSTQATESQQTPRPKRYDSDPIFDIDQETTSEVHDHSTDTYEEHPTASEDDKGKELQTQQSGAKPVDSEESSDDVEDRGVSPDEYE